MEHDMNEQHIKEFLTKMRAQDNRATAFPFYYVIRTEVEDMAPVENCDYTRWYWQDSSYESLEAIEKYCKENDYTEKEISTAKREAQEYGVKKRWDKRGMFLTETDAINHLKLNYYHYSHNAHNFVEHAWRAPELSEFFNNLFEYFQIQEPPKK
jgi:hypothetical protein